MNTSLLLCALAATLSAQEAAKPQPDSPLHYSSDVGYRFLAGQHGSFNTYRSVNNLGEGPRLLQFQMNYKPPATRYLSELRVVGANWGDPLNSFQLNAEKTAIYRIGFSYRNLAYFNALPSFASPQLAKLGPEAYTTNQRSMDTRQRFWNLDLDLLPRRRWQPFFGVAHNSGLGRGISPIVLDENNYPASSQIDYGYTVFRGGLRLELEGLHLTLEQGGATFHDDTSLLNSIPNTGNRENPYLGRQLLLNQASQLYGVSGNQIYSSADLTVSPLSWLDLSAEYYYSRPRSDVRFNESAQGTILWLDSLRFVNGQQSVATGYANQPRSAGGLTVEIRPWKRIRILDAWMIERMHTAGSVALLTTLNTSPLLPVNLNDRLVWQQNEQRVQVFFDLSQKLTFFGGHRYLWGESQVRRASLSPGPAQESGYLNRHSGIGGLIFRATPKLTINAETEVGRGSQTYFRTSLQNFEQVRLRARYQISEAWQINSRYSRMNNYNPTPGVNLDFESQQSNFTLQWTRKIVSLMADYTRSSIRGDLSYLNPVTYDAERSLYVDNAHSATLAADFNLPRKASLTVGGSLFVSAGSRPSRFYQPLCRLRIPVSKNAGFLAEWRNVSLGQSLYAYEAFGVQQFTIGLRVSH
jgi:hypothetical protein